MKIFSYLANMMNWSCKCSEKFLLLFIILRANKTTLRLFKHGLTCYPDFYNHNPILLIISSYCNHIHNHIDHFLYDYRLTLNKHHRYFCVLDLLRPWILFSFLNNYT